MRRKKIRENTELIPLDYMSIAAVSEVQKARLSRTECPADKNQSSLLAHEKAALVTGKFREGD